MPSKRLKRLARINNQNTRKFKILDLFCGTQSVLESFPNADYKGFDLLPITKSNIILDLTEDDIVNKVIALLPEGWKPDFIWASPTCKAWSIAAISHHFKVRYEGKKIVERIPTSDFAVLSVKMVENTKKIIEHFNVPFAIENPRGTLRKHPVFQDYHIDTAMYCKYGDTRMKPTDIWSNKPLHLKKCKNGSPCHVAAPRGAKTGTQGLKNNTERSKVPPLLIKEVVKQLFAYPKDKCIVCDKESYSLTKLDKHNYACPGECEGKAYE